MFTTISMKRILIVLLPLMALISCNKDSELPPATDTGNGTFGAKIDGTVWAPKGYGIFPANDILEARMSGNNLIINARNFASSPTETEFQLTIINVTGPGTYLLNTDTPHPTNWTSSYGFYVKRTMSPENEWITTPAYTGWVNISKLDLVNRIVAGTFEFDANGRITPGVIHVTEGRFDVKIL